MVEQGIVTAVEKPIAKSGSVTLGKIGWMVRRIGHAKPPLHRPSGAEARQGAFSMQRRIDADTERSPIGEVLTRV